MLLYSVAHPIEISRDIHDNIVLETAQTGEADYIVTGDNDLLVLSEHAETKIVKSAELLDLA